MKFVTAFVNLVFTVTSVTWALPAETATASQNITPAAALSALAVPAEIGQIETVYFGDKEPKQNAGSDGSQSSDPEQRFVVLIQDAHAIVDAQQNIQKLIEHFDKTYGVRLVAVEGAKSKLDPTIFRAFPDQNIKKKVLAGYLKRAEITGAQMAAIFDEEEHVFSGIEDWELYKANYRAYLRAQDAKSALEAKWKEFKARLDETRKTVYSEKLNEFQDRCDEFRAERADFSEFLMYLVNFKKVLARDPQLSELNKLVGSVGYAASGNQEKLIPAIKEMAAEFKVKYARGMAVQDEMNFYGSYQAFLTGKMESGQFLQRMIELGHSRGFRPKLTHAMRRLLGHTETLSSIKGSRLFTELQTGLDTIEQSLITKREEKELAGKYRRLFLLRDLFSLELTHETLAQYRQAPETYSGLLEDPAFQDGLAPAVEFYELALKRDEAFYENLTALMKGQKQNTAVVVTGGFHTNGLRQILEERKIGYAVVSPRMASLAGAENYAKVMRNDVSYKEYLQTTYYDAFVRDATQRFIGEMNQQNIARDLKTWRDDLIRNLARQGRVAEAGNYTRYLDALAKIYVEKFSKGPARSKDEILKILTKELNNFRDQNLEHMRQRFEFQLGRFIDSLKDLLDKKQVTSDNVATLLDKINKTKPAVLGEPAVLEPGIFITELKTPAVPKINEQAFFEGMEAEEVPARSESRAKVLGEEELVRLKHQLDYIRQQNPDILPEEKIEEVLQKVRQGILPLQNEDYDVIDRNPFGEERVLGAVNSAVVEDLGFLHRVSNAFVVTPEGEVLFQLRSHLKKSMPLILSTFGGHVGHGETYEQARARELIEEMHFPSDWSLQGRFISIGNRPGPPGHNIRQELSLYFLSREEIDLMNRHRERVRKIEEQKNVEEFKRWLEHEFEQGSEFGDAWGFYELGLEDILGVAEGSIVHPLTDRFIDGDRVVALAKFSPVVSKLFREEGTKIFRHISGTKKLSRSEVRGRAEESERIADRVIEEIKGNPAVAVSVVLGMAGVVSAAAYSFKQFWEQRVPVGVLVQIRTGERIRGKGAGELTENTMGVFDNSFLVSPLQRMQCTLILAIPEGNPLRIGAAHLYPFRKGELIPDRLLQRRLKSIRELFSAGGFRPQNTTVALIYNQPSSANGQILEYFNKQQYSKVARYNIPTNYGTKVVFEKTKPDSWKVSVVEMLGEEKTEVVQASLEQVLHQEGITPTHNLELKSFQQFEPLGFRRAEVRTETEAATSSPVKPQSSSVFPPGEPKLPVRSDPLAGVDSAAVVALVEKPGGIEMVRSELREKGWAELEKKRAEFEAIQKKFMEKMAGFKEGLEALTFVISPEFEELILQLFAEFGDVTELIARMRNAAVFGDTGISTGVQGYGDRTGVLDYDGMAKTGAAVEKMTGELIGDTKGPAFSLMMSYPGRDSEMVLRMIKQLDLFRLIVLHTKDQPIGRAWGSVTSVVYDGKNIQLRFKNVTRGLTGETMIGWWNEDLGLKDVSLFSILAEVGRISDPRLKSLACTILRYIFLKYASLNKAEQENVVAKPELILADLRKIGLGEMIQFKGDTLYFDMQRFVQNYLIQKSVEQAA